MTSDSTITEVSEILCKRFLRRLDLVIRDCSVASRSTVPGWIERSSHETAQRCAAGAGLDGEGSDQAIMVCLVMSDEAISEPCPFD